jgi:peptidoglycan/xylan/chitin deacetylase (PgdA/CDA1 family)
MTIDILGLTCRLALHSFSVLESRLSIVMFHSVLDAPDPLRKDSPGIAEFDAQIRWLSGSFRILPLRQATEKLWAGQLPARALCITFDDGYRDNVLNALPVLLKYQVPATFFVTTRYTHGGMMWNDRVIEAIRAWPRDTIEMASYGLEDVALGEDRHDAALRMLGCIKYLPYDEREAVTTELLARSGARPARMMMDDAEIRDLHRAGMEIGGHTVTHPILCALDDQRVRQEIIDNKSQLETILGERIDSFAYPNGRPQTDFAARHIAMLRDSGYVRAVTTAAGTSNAATNPWQLPRYTPWDLRHWRYLGQMLKNYFVAGEQLPGTPTAAPR